MKSLLPFSGIYLLLTILLCVEPVQSQESFDSASQSGILGTLRSTARSAAMGSGLAGVGGDLSSLFSNPAGLGLLRSGEVSFNSDFWLGSTFQETALLGIPLGPYGTIAGAGSYLDYGSFEGRDLNGSLVGSYNASQFAGRVAWGMEISSGFCLGAGLNGSRAELAGVLDQALGGEVGVLWTPLKNLCLGASYENIPLASTAPKMVSAVNLGASYKFSLGSRSDLLAVLGTALEPDALSYLQGGLEYGLEGRFFFRVGLQQPLEDNALGGLNGFTAGIGVVLADLRFDYAYLPYGDLGNSHQISLGYQFNDVPFTKDPTDGLKSSMAQPQLEGGVPATNTLKVQFDIPSDDLLEGQELEKKGKTEEALRVYVQAVKDNPEDPGAWWALGNAYFHQGDKEHAVPCFEKVLILRPGAKGLKEWLEKYKVAKP